MKHINHVTLNTGHVRKTYPDEVDKKLYFAINRILKDSYNAEGTELLPGYRLKSTNAEIATIATIFATADNVPILTTAVCRRDDGNAVWRLMHTTMPFGGPLETKIDKPVESPYIADRLEVGAFTHMDAMRWTGDFSRCFGWAVLDPRQIR